jgi:hypothetical protein
VSSVDQAVIDLVEGVSIWGLPSLKVDLFVHEVRIFDFHLPYRWLMYGFPANFCVRVSHHQLHVIISHTKCKKGHFGCSCRRKFLIPTEKPQKFLNIFENF